jgi:quercetin dioxygenase-like cupin family protein
LGNALAFHTANSLVRSEGPELICLGLDDVVAVATDAAVLLAKRSYAQKLGEIVEKRRNDTARQPSFAAREWNLEPGTFRAMEKRESGFSVVICTAGRGQIATGVHEHALEPGSTVRIAAGDSCRVEANTDSFLRVIEIRVAGE